MTILETAGVPPTEYSQAFMQGMVDRMSMSYFKYGAVADAYPKKFNALKSLQQRLDKYAETGNTEYLIDAANFAMIEFMAPAHPQAFFTATDADGSPGRTTNAGTVTESSNTVDRENVRRGGSTRTTSGGFYKREGD